MLDAPVRSRTNSPGDDDGRRASGPPSQRRDPVPDLREDYGPRRTNSRGPSGKGVVRRAEFDQDAEDALAARRARGIRLRLEGRVPTSVAARVVAGVVVLAGFGGIAFGLWEARAALLHDARLNIPSSRAIQITGNNHLSRPQLLSVFGGDVDRNVLSVPLDARRAELESLPWVEHATVMRLLPNQVRVSIVERTPVAFVRQGNEIGLVDAHGVLLDMSPDSDHGYSFPVVTGLSNQDPASTRAARMRVYQQFTSELDAGPDKLSGKLSEVDLSDPDDVKALLPDSGTDVLVHFGDKDYLARYQRYLQNLPDWKTRYPKLASVDMRYEREVVLEMTPGSTVPVATEAAVPPTPASVGKRAAAAKLALKKPFAVKPGAKPAWKPKPAPASHASHLQKSLVVHPKAGPR